MAKVVVTGITSFVGVHLAQAFAAAGWEVVATHSRAQENYGGIQAQRLAATPGRLARLDLRDDSALATFVTTERPQVWIHHAGHATDYASPDYDLMGSLAINVQPLPTLYRALAEAGGGGGVLISGSSMEYAASDQPNREDECCWPDSPYGLSKLAETLAARQQAARFGVPTRVARIYIPFGPLDNPRKLLAQVVTALAKGETVKLSPCRQRRDFIAVSELARGYLALAADLKRGGFDAFNLCSGVALPLSELLSALATRMGADPALLAFGAIAMRPGEPEVSYGDAGKAGALLGWTARSPLECLDSLLV